MEYNLISKSGKNIKSIVLLISFLFVSILTYSQQQAFTLEFEVIDASGTNSDDGRILVKVNGSNSHYLFVLYDKVTHILEDFIDKSDRTDLQQYQFDNLKSGDYFICVWDGDNNMACDKVKVGHK